MIPELILLACAAPMQVAQLVLTCTFVDAQTGPKYGSGHRDSSSRPPQHSNWHIK